MRCLPIPISCLRRKGISYILAIPKLLRRKHKLNTFEEKTYKLISREVEISDFEKWIYSEKKLEKLLTYDDYLELISLTYTTPSTLYEAEKILKKYIKIEKYHEWYLRKILQKIIEHPSNVYKYISQTYDMYCDGYYFLENIGIGYGLSIEVPPSSYSAQTWEELEPIEQKVLVNSYYPNIQKEADPLCQDRCPLNFHFINNPSGSGKRRTCQDIAKPSKNKLSAR